MYALVDDFVLRIGEQESIELTDREMVGVVDEATLEVALADSSSQIDGYFKWALPSAIKDCTAKFKAYLL